MLPRNVAQAYRLSIQKKILPPNTKQENHTETTCPYRKAGSYLPLPKTGIPDPGWRIFPWKKPFLYAVGLHTFPGGIRRPGNGSERHR
jgi:hypothetical protein